MSRSSKKLKRIKNDIYELLEQKLNSPKAVNNVNRPRTVMTDKELASHKRHLNIKYIY